MDYNRRLIPRAVVSMAVKRAILSRIRRKHPTILKISFLIAFIFAITLLINKVIQPGNNGHTNEELSNLLIAEPTELSFWDRADVRNGENTKKIDWHDYKYLYREAKRKGLGENGEKAQLGTDDKQNEEKVFALSGYNGLLSDKISSNRSVKDIRHPECRKKEYLANLPTFSVILPFYNEHFSTLMRSVHSVINRSPPHLLRQVVLVDDGSTKESLKEDLDNYLKYNISKTVVVRIPKREGLIRARLAGAKKTSADVLIFLDSHVEASTNWIPPLLEPIAMDYRTCVCPFIDVIDHTNFEYRAQDEGARGAFDWRFYYKRLPLLPEDLKHPSAPFRSPVMAGGLFAISSKFFWELGGYDEGLLIWGGEQYELSFKIWQCGGQMLDAPCSRVGHIYRKFVPFPDPGIGDFLGRNYRRVAEVWMDEYADYLYSRNPHWKTIDTGDISAQLAIRKKWNCKPFKWFMEEVAFDLPKKYPYVEPESLFSGEIRSIANPNLCINARIPKPHEDLTVTECNNVTGNDDDNLKFKMTYLRDIRLKTKNFCLDVSRSENPSTIQLYECHGGQGNQEWNFDQEKHWLVQGRNRRCLDIDVDNLKVFVKYCDSTSKTQQWHVDNINLKMIAQYAKSNS